MINLKQKFQIQDRAIWLRLIGFFLGFQWFMAGIEKVLDPGFNVGLGKTLGFFASKNPYSWYVNLINAYFIPNAQIFAWFTSWGELLVGLALILGFLTNLTLIIAIFMNLNFYFAAGWTGPSTAGINILMILVQIILILAYGSKVISLDELIAAKLHRMKRLLLSKS